jgi:hypothetical protein
VLLIVLKRFAPRVPGTLVVLALAIASSAALHFSAHGIDVIEELIDELATDQIELRLASARAPAIAVLERAGLIERIKLVATIDEGVART